MELERPGRLLFVDDELAILSALRRAFRNSKYEIEVASDGASGLEVFRRFRPTVVVSDCRMPKMSGVEFLAKARAIDPEPVRVMLTGYTELPAAEAAINQGEVWRFVTKPWNDDELRATIAGANERYRLVSENRILADKLAAIGMLAGGVAHEINNPLGGILAYCDLMQRDLDPAAQVAQDVAKIGEAALRAKRIVSDLLDFARTAHGAERGPVTLASVAEKAVALARFQLRGVSVSVEHHASAPVLADSNRLQQVVLNLLSNAIHAITKASVPSGAITLKTWQAGAEMKLAVIDNGPGIPVESHERVFEAFFTTKPAGEGTGLGLAVSLGIMRDHGGRIEHACTPGGGATFVVSIPSLPQEVTKQEMA